MIFMHVSFLDPTTCTGVRGSGWHGTKHEREARWRMSVAGWSPFVVTIYLILLRAQGSGRPLAKMSDLSDLELVAQAMAPTNQPRSTESQPARAIQPAGSEHTKNGLQPSEATAPPSRPAAFPSGSSAAGSPVPIDAPGPASLGLPEGLADLDLSSLSPADMELLRPLLAAMNLASGAGGDEDDDARIGELLAQMDAAGEVADELEDKLDKLIAQLGAEEKQIQEGLPEGAGEVKKAD